MQISANYHLRKIELRLQGMSFILQVFIIKALDEYNTGLMMMSDKKSDDH